MVEECLTGEYSGKVASCIRAETHHLVLRVDNVVCLTNTE